jgi:hypothetical protein
MALASALKPDTEKNIILLNIDYLFSVSNLSGAFNSFHEGINQAER